MFRQQFCNFTVNNGTSFSRESGLWLFSVIRLAVKLNCSSSDRRQNSLSEVIICLMDSVMQSARKWVHLLSRYSLRSRTKDGNSLTDFLMFSKDCIMSSRFVSLKSWAFSDPSQKKSVCSLQAGSVCHSSFGACAYHDGNCMGTRNVSCQLCLLVLVLVFCKCKCRD